MDYIEIIKLIGIILSFIVGTAIPFVIALVKKIKAVKAAKTEAEKEKAYNDLVAFAKVSIAKAETEYKSFDDYLKAKNQSSAGATKKNSVMTDLKGYALEKGYAFDVDAWSKTIDELVAFTKEVNAKK